MDAKKAIEVLEEYRDEALKDNNAPEGAEAFALAIEALRARPAAAHLETCRRFRAEVALS